MFQSSTWTLPIIQIVDSGSFISSQSSCHSLFLKFRRAPREPMLKEGAPRGLTCTRKIFELALVISFC